MPWALIFLSACRPVDRAFPANEVSLVVSSTKLEIEAALDGTASAEIHVWNDAGDGATLSAEAFGTGFGVVGGPWPLVGLTQIRITITFAPESAETATGTLVLEAGPEDAAVALVGLVTTDWDCDGYHSVEGGDVKDCPEGGDVKDCDDGWDCDDRDASIHPCAEEVWYDGVDQNCDGNDLDQDGDKFDVTSDCNDLDSNRNPGASESLDGDGVDEDCDGIADETLAAGKLIITEIFLEPATAPDLYGQFIEVHNSLGSAVGLAGWTLESDGASGVVAPVTIESDGYAVLCPSIVVDELPCDAVVQPWPTFLASADSVTLFADAPDAQFQDDVTWNASDWPIVKGASMMLAPGSMDTESNNRFESWCVAPEPWPGGELGSPGLENDCGGP